MAPGGERRTIPLREVVLPHHCPRPVRMDVLSRTPYFAGLGPDALDGIDRRMRARTVRAHEHVYVAGEPADALYVVAQGAVSLAHVTEDGAPTLTDVLVPGELFGAMGTLGEPVHLQTATALVDTCALRIGQDDFRAVLRERPVVALRVLDDVAARLARAHDDIGGQSTDTVPQRVATALLRLADKVGRDRPGEGLLLEVPLSRADLAALARTTPESVSRVMSGWKQQGVVASGRRWTAILDRDRLEREARGSA